jgi:hypothetical protein
MPGPLDSQGFSQGFVSALTDIDTYARDMVGSIRRELNGIYKYVQFGSSIATGPTAAIPAGSTVCYVLPAGNATLQRMMLCDSANSALGAGVAQGSVPAGQGLQFGWIQIRGTATLGAALQSGAVGNNLSTTGAVALGMKVAAAVTDQIVAEAVDLTTAAAPVVLLNFPY